MMDVGGSVAVAVEVQPRVPRGPYSCAGIVGFSFILGWPGVVNHGYCRATWQDRGPIYIGVQNQLLTSRSTLLARPWQPPRGRNERSWVRKRCASSSGPRVPQAVQRLFVTPDPLTHGRDALPEGRAGSRPIVQQIGRQSLQMRGIHLVQSNAMAPAQVAAQVRDLVRSLDGKERHALDRRKHAEV